MSPVDGVTLDEATTSSAAHVAAWSVTSKLGGCLLGRPTNLEGCQWPMPRCWRLGRGRRVSGSTRSRRTGVGVARLNQLVAAERIPFEVHTDGRRIHRREQLLTVANARDARWHGRARIVGGR